MEMKATRGFDDVLVEAVAVVAVFEVFVCAYLAAWAMLVEICF